MAIPTNAENRRINAQTQIPSRSAAVAGNDGRIPSAVDVLNFNAEFPSINVVVNHTRTDYVITVPPNTAGTAPDLAEVIPNPQVGDRAFVFLVDSAQANKPHGYQEWHRTGTAWQRVAYA